MFILTFYALFFQSLLADSFHYNNFITGDRAMGLSGSYTAISDDASAVIYNPAGLGFCSNSSMSGSVNAYYTRQTTYNKALGTLDFIEYSSGFLPGFFSAIQQLPIGKGFMLALGFYPKEFEQKDQNDSIVAYSLSKDTSIEEFHRTIIRNAYHLSFVVGLGKLITQAISLGLNVKYSLFSDRGQEYQNVIYRVNNVRVASKPAPVSLFLNSAQNVRTNLALSFVEPQLGVQMSFWKYFSVGLSATYPIIVYQKNSYDQDTLKVGRDNNYRVFRLDDLDTSQDANSPETLASLKKFNLNTNNIVQVTPNSNSNIDSITQRSGNPGHYEGDFYQSWPMEFRAGLAWFASPRFLMSGDVVYNYSLPYEALLSDYTRQSVLNYSLGMEYYILSSLPIRLGGFTNFDARPPPTEALLKQRMTQIALGQPVSYMSNESVDHYGISLALGWTESKSQISIASILQLGKGSAVKVQDAIQSVSALSLTIAFSATHYF